MAEGRCNCGAVRYAVTVDLGDVFVCHCSICRGWSGTNGMAVAIVPNDAFEWLEGREHVGHWSKPDGAWESWFCRVCGSALPGANDAECTFVPVGTLRSGAEGLRVAHHLWVGSRAAWDEIGDAGRRHERGYEPAS